MANRRMFSKSIIESDPFMDMPITSQLLYFYLGLNADDDGFVMPKRIMRMTSAGDDDLKILIAKGFVLPFASGVTVIRHWKANNFIRTDRYEHTVYKEEFKQLYEDNNKYYSIDNQVGYTKSIPLVDPGKVSIGKERVRLGKSSPIRKDQGQEKEADMSEEALARVIGEITF